MPVKIPGTHKMARIEVGTKNTDAYRDGWDRIFGKKERTRSTELVCSKCGLLDLMETCLSSKGNCPGINEGCPALCQCEEPHLITFDEFNKLLPTQDGGDA